MLPVDSFKTQILETVDANPVTIIVAETGAGKSTQVPKWFVERGDNVLITQPRRLAARSVAARVAEELGVSLGSLIGYRTGEDRMDSEETRGLFVTDGLALVRELVGAGKHRILFMDEVHEWNLNIEVLAAWAKHQIEAGADFKLVLMSATLEAERLSEFFNGAPIVRVPGRTYPVETRTPSGNAVTDAVKLVREGRNVLVFQPGKAEIQDVVSSLTGFSLDAEIIPLHGELEPTEQQKAFRHYDRPKVVVATNVAQTSITIDDIDAVVDGGQEKRVEVVDGVEGLYLRPISFADSAQRKGRAGRCRDGIYYDECPAHPGDRPEFPTAEILRVRLDMTVLRLLMAGIDMEELEFFHQPPKDQIHEAKRALVALGCLDKDHRVTPIGRQVSRLPLSASIGRMVVEAMKRGVLEDIVTIAAIMEIGGIVDRKNNAWLLLIQGEKESDLLAQLTVFKAAKDFHGDDFKENGVFKKNYFKVLEIVKNIRRSLGHGIKFESTGHRTDIMKAICAGMVDHLFKCSSGYMLNGDDVLRERDKNSIVWPDKWAVGKPFDLEISTRRGSKTTLRLVQMITKVEPSWLVEVAPQLVEEVKGLSPRYLQDQDVVASTTKVSFNGTQVSEIAVKDAEHPEASTVFGNWLADQMV